MLNRLKQDGTAIVFISHKLGEVLEVADRITVLRRGKKVDTVPREGATELSLARLVVGRDVLLSVEKTPGKPAGPLLEVRDLHVRDDRELEKVSGLSLTVRAGEIVAIAGVDGNGQQELVDAITGMRAPESGAVAIDGQEIAGKGVRAATDAGVAHIAEDRQLRGLVLPFTLAENLALREYRSPELSGRGWLRLASHEGARREAADRVRRPRRRTRDATPRHCRAATSRRSRSRARSLPTPRCWSPTSRPVASTSARSSSSTAG